VKWSTPQEPNINLLTGHPYLLWLLKFYNAFKRVDQNYERITSVSANYTALLTDCVIECDVTSASITVTLPAQADLGYGKKYILQQIDASANTVTIATADSANVNTAVTVPLTSQWATITLIANGTDWIGY